MFDEDKGHRSLAEIQALGLPRMKSSDVFVPKEGSLPDWYPAVTDEYLSHFVQPKSPKMECVKCETPQTGMLAALTGGGFTWGIAHGEGFCQNCRWPARVYHRIKDKNGEEVMSLTLLLQYHPDELEDPKSQVA